MTTTDKTVIGFLDACRRVDEVSTHYQIEYEPAQALQFVRSVEGYNGFTTQDLVRLILRCNELVPPMQFGEGNPNNGRPHHHFLIGNEGSRVIYLSVYKAYLKEFNYLRLTSALKAAAQTAHTDEYDVTEDNAYSFTYRFWWD